MKQTAMQEHIEWLNATIEIAEEERPTLVNVLKLCLNNATQKLELEKKQIANAFNKGGGYPYETGINRAEQYYNDTYKSE